ncbi:hypothetical protein, partial [Silvibacterium sp.]|uniref:hypothetical protein n=1 Tax=Silvibacterium sp. TaxID=1964179 RepID=UPI0039E27BD5
PIFGLDFKLDSTPRLYTLILLGTAAMMLAFRAGVISYMGAVIDAGHLSVGADAASWFLPPLTSISAAEFLRYPGLGWRKWLLGACALSLLVMQAITGRRVLVYTCAMTIFMARILGLRLFGNLRRQFLVLAGVAVLILVLSLGFMLLRMAGYGRGDADVSLSERVAIASLWVENGTAFDRALSSTQENVQTRTFILGFFSELLGRSERLEPALGQDAYAQIQTAVPSAINPHKDRYLAEEQMADLLFGFTYVDEANSILTAGALDFGMIGVILYPIILAWGLRHVVEFISGFLHPLSALFLVMTCLFQTLATENGITSFFVTILHGCIFLAVLELFFRFPAFRMRPAARTAGL